MPKKSSRILLASLNDAEFSTNNENLLRTASSFLESEDKYLAQTATAFLINCGDNLGEKFLQELLDKQELPYSKLIQGMKDLLK